MNRTPDNDLDDSAEYERGLIVEDLSEKLWHLARMTNGTAWDNQREDMNLLSSEQAVGDWLRRLREKHGIELQIEVHRSAVGYGEEMISRMEAELLEMRRGQAVLDRTASELVRSLIQVAKPES
jgi:hypothetical protein